MSNALFRRGHGVGGPGRLPTPVLMMSRDQDYTLRVG
jgi:hypothetical protein